MLFHIGTFHLDVDSQRQSPWHCLNPASRIVCAVLLAFATALTPHGRWLTWAIYAVALTIALLISRVTLTTLLRRVSVEFLFVGVVLLGTLFHPEGEVLWQWGWLRVTTHGLAVLGSVMLKALLSLLVLNLLVMTTAIPALLNGLLALRVPPLLVAILAAMSRYISVLVEESNAMRRAAAARNLFMGDRQTRLVTGNIIGSLFIRTVDRGERIHRAMLSRGYAGLPRPVEQLTYRRCDFVAVTLTGLVTLLGQAIYLF
ncbi:MAG TPA: cobalt ECF transporter T component CbiQ [Synechococcales cyanobacterium M55_K2018_004]|nr:cobalt ECF transporter T component CbiQ [Synechococcales cyanobacterium M55_K2018_004]